MNIEEQIEKINALVEQEKYEEAIGLINEALEDNPEEINLLLIKSKLFKQLQKFSDALNILQELLKLDPDHKEANNMKSMIQEIVRFEQLDIYSSTNLSNDPWLDD